MLCDHFSKIMFVINNLFSLVSIKDYFFLFYKPNIQALLGFLLPTYPCFQLSRWDHPVNISTFLNRIAPPNKRHPARTKHVT